jgi:hypothetical protein
MAPTQCSLRCNIYVCMFVCAYVGADGANSVQSQVHLKKHVFMYVRMCICRYLKNMHLCIFGAEIVVIRKIYKRRC